MMLLYFNVLTTTEIYTLSLHDALPISGGGSDARSHQFHRSRLRRGSASPARRIMARAEELLRSDSRSEEHTSELQSQFHLVCRLLLEKKNFTYRHWNEQIAWT